MSGLTKKLRHPLPIGIVITCVKCLSLAFEFEHHVLWLTVWASIVRSQPLGVDLNICSKATLQDT